MAGFSNFPTHPKARRGAPSARAQLPFFLEWFDVCGIARVPASFKKLQQRAGTTYPAVNSVTPLIRDQFTLCSVSTAENILDTFREVLPADRLPITPSNSIAIYNSYIEGLGAALERWDHDTDDDAWEVLQAATGFGIGILRDIGRGHCAPRSVVEHVTMSAANSLQIPIIEIQTDTNSRPLVEGKKRSRISDWLRTRRPENL